MADPFIGEIRMFAGNYAPRDWAFCDGHLVPLFQNSTLFSIIGTYFGGDARTTMGLPNLQGRAPMGSGTAPGLTHRYLGSPVGVSGVALDASQIGVHRHQLNGSTAKATATTVEDHVLANPAGVPKKNKIYTDPDAPVSASPSVIEDSVGGNTPHTNVQPFLGMNFIISLSGIYPARS